MIYIDVILPLPLEGLFTYSVHANDAHKAVVGKRVVVPLGRSKTYTGIIERVHRLKMLSTSPMHCLWYSKSSWICGNGLHFII